MRRGGDRRGNTKDRRARKLFLLNKHGDGVTAPCHECGTEVDYDTMVVDRIEPGGTYGRTNIRIHCYTCSHKQGYAMGIGKLKGDTVSETK